MNQVKHGRRRHGPVRTCPVQGRASRKDNYVFRSDRRISARLGHDTDSSRLRARCLRVNVQRSSVNSLSSCGGVSISDEIKIIAIYVRNGSKNASGIPDNRDREFGVFLNKEEKLGNSFESLVDDFQVKVIGETRARGSSSFSSGYISLINGLENICFFLTDEKAFNLSDSFDCGIIGSETRYDELNFPFHL